MAKTLPAEDYKKILQVMPILTVDGLVYHKGKILLLKRKNKPLKGKYWTPGGRVYKGETLKEAFIRKMQEETGIKVRVLSVIGYYEDFYEDNHWGIPTVHTVSVVFLATADTDKVKLDSQSSVYKWVTKIPDRLKILVPLQHIGG